MVKDKSIDPLMIEPYHVLLLKEATCTTVAPIDIVKEIGMVFHIMVAMYTLFAPP